jgi:hypothetical protein
MLFAQDHDVIQAFSADRADEPFDVAILPGVTVEPSGDRGCPSPQDAS